MTIDAFETGPMKGKGSELLASSGVSAAPTCDITAALEAMVASASAGESVAISAASDQDNFPPVAGSLDDPTTPLGGWPKRLLDLTVATVALVIAAPVMLVIMVLLRLTLGSPVIFSHGRIGFSGKPFACFKFRTMIADAQAVLEAHLENDPLAAREWAETQKLRQDPRITPFGQMLRKSSLDELPQLFNILRGDMSCVGPRPVVPAELQRYGPFAADYMRTRPGLTGAWQVAGRNATDYTRRVVLDTQYVRNWSLWGDLVILWRTLFAVIRFDQTS